MQERRKDDERILSIHNMVTEMNVLVQQTHAALFGNGKEGMKTEFERFKGALSVWKWIAGGSGLVGIIALLLSLVKMLRG